MAGTLKPVPHLDVRNDMGNFVYVVSRLSPGKSYMASGTECRWRDYMTIWSQVTGRNGRYVQATFEEMIEAASDKEFARELGEMFLCSSEPGYDGGDETLLRPADIEKLSGPTEILLVFVLINSCHSLEHNAQ